MDEAAAAPVTQGGLQGPKSCGQWRRNQQHAPVDGGPPGDVQPKRCNRVVLAIGPTTAYLILAVVFLVVLGGGTWLAYYMERRRATDHAGEGPHRPS